ncbi:MAG: UDP-3-O-(3-hydroxymyristoyl)glucosamine N-acyltransferase [Desulfofustis sp.]|nr:UDP-3-O-(3-hydroxymyristoyl)glucosamine N-acyltransferase [Desulfofustis sp.]
MEKKLTLETLARMVEGELSGDPSLEISGFGPLDSAGPGDISFLVDVKYYDQAVESGAAAILVGKKIAVEVDNFVRVDDAYLASAIIQNHFLAHPFDAGGIHDSAVIGQNCRFGKEITIGAQVAIGDRVTLGEQVEICAGVVIGPDVTIGDGSTIKSNVTIEHGCELGERVVIHPGCVIGSDGYGYATDKRGFHVKRPQLGTVKIGDDVEIGANSCVDRATFGVTWIKSGTKIDNLVQVGHNVVVGENSLLVAQVGIAGSTTLGRNVVMGGQAGAVGHISVGDGTMVAGMSAIHGNQPAGARLAGIPAIEGRQWFKSATAFSKLPELLKDVRKIKKVLASRKDQDESPNKEG